MPEKYPVYHITCRNLAFYYEGKIEAGQALDAFRCIPLAHMPRVKPYDPVVCGSCMKAVLSGELDWSKASVRRRG